MSAGGICLEAEHEQLYCSSSEKMTLLMALMYRMPSGSVTFSLVRGGATLLVKYLNAGLGDRMAARNTLKQTHSTGQTWVLFACTVTLTANSPGSCQDLKS